MENTCIICGAEVPEGRQVCPKCEANRDADLKAAHEEIGRLRARLDTRAKEIEVDISAAIEKVKYALHDTVGDFCNMCVNEFALCVDMKRDDWKWDLEWHKNRNAELKAKLEKSVEFPCRVGEMAVAIFEYDEKSMLEIGKVESLSIDESGIWVNCFYDCGLRYYHKVGNKEDLVFYGKTAKEQAEARLKELKGDK